MDIASGVFSAMFVEMDPLILKLHPPRCNQFDLKKKKIFFKNTHPVNLLWKIQKEQKITKIRGFWHKKIAD